MTFRDIPQLGLVNDYVAYYARTSPSTIAYSSEERSLTYSDVQREVQRYANAMRASGVGPGDFIGVFSPTRIECYVVFLACCAIGATYAGLNAKHTARELDVVLGDIRPALVFAFHAPQHDERASALREALGSSGSECEVVSRATAPSDGSACLDDFLARGDGSSVGNREIPEVGPEHTAAIVYTSGSTGRPKGALLSQRAMIRSAYLSWRYWHGALADVRTNTHHPISHVGWLIGKGLATFIAGGTLFVREQFDPSETARMLEQEALTLWIVHPAELMMVMETSEFQTTDLSRLQHVSLATLTSVELLEAFRRRTTATLCGSYGLTEACGGAILATDYDADITTVASSVGRPLPGAEARLVDPSGVDVQPGQPGELLLRDASVFSGYLNNADATADAIDADGWLHTGDAMLEDSNGNFHFAGRLKEMFKSGGYNVYPTEIETVIAGHPSILAAAVVDAPHPVWTQVGVAFVVPKAGVNVTSEDVEQHCRSELANYKVPKVIRVVDQIPRLPNGKMDRLKLRSWAETMMKNGTGAHGERSTGATNGSATN